MIRIGCASAIIDSSGLFANRKKQASIDIDTLQRILEQDAPGSCLNAFNNNEKCNDTYYYTKYCAVGSETYAELQRAVSSKRLPDRVCVSKTEMQDVVKNNSPLEGVDNNSKIKSITDKCQYAAGTTAQQKCYCGSNPNAYWDSTENKCKCEVEDTVFVYSLAKCMSQEDAKNVTSGLFNDCTYTGGGWTGYDCVCPEGKVSHVVGNSIVCADRMDQTNCSLVGGKWKDDKCKCSNDYVLERKSERCPDNNKYELKLDWKRK
jgi:hypothetical protein